MLTVNISVNGKSVYTRSAHRRTLRHSKGKENAYLLDTGEQIFHNPDKGIVPLAIKMLETIKQI